MLGAERALARSVTSIRLRSIALLGSVYNFLNGFNEKEGGDRHRPGGEEDP